TVDVAQPVRAPDCGSGGRGFESHHPPQGVTGVLRPRHGRGDRSRPSRHARMAELVDALDLGSSGLAVRVQVPLLAPRAASPPQLAASLCARAARARRRPMRTELIDKKAVEATVRVTVPAEQVDAAFEEVVSDLARRVKIPGFRPGRVPRGVL